MGYRTDDGQREPMGHAAPADPVARARAELLAALVAAPRDAATGEPDYTDQRLRLASIAYIVAIRKEREGRR